MDKPRQEGPDKESPILEEQNGSYERFEDKMDRMGLMLAVTDLERARAFYVDRMGFRVMQSYPPGAETPEGYSVNYERTHLMLFNKMTQMFPWLKDGRGSGILPYIEVDNVDGLYEPLKGSDYVKEPLENKPWGHRMFVFTDPDGHTLAFYKPLRRR